MSRWETRPAFRLGRCSPTPSGRSRSSCWRGRRRSSSSLRSRRAPARPPRTLSSVRSRRGCATTGRWRTTSRSSRRRFATARSRRRSRTRWESSREEDRALGAAAARASRPPVSRQRRALRRDGGSARRRRGCHRRQPRAGGRDRRVLLRRRDGMELEALAGAASRRGTATDMTATGTLDALVESLCGDLSRIRAPRGTELHARAWATEAPLRMLLNNLDPEVAERPEELVVYGGSGKAARNPAALRALVRSLLELGDDETLLVQSGKPVGVFRTHAWAPRVLIANSNLVGDWATWPEFRRLEALGLIMYGQMTAGSWIYIGTQGILQGTYDTFAAVAAKRFDGSLAGRLVVTAGLGGMGGAQPLAVTLNEGCALCVEVDLQRIERRLA